MASTLVQRAAFETADPDLACQWLTQAYYQVPHLRSAGETGPGPLVRFAGHSAAGISATVALGTNSDGAFTGTNAYSATDRGTDWAAQLVAPLRAVAPRGLTVVGANDIESGDFAATREQAMDWERAYLAVDNSAGGVGALIYNGSADGCPTTLGLTGTACGSGWTQADYYLLAHGLDPARILVLPQVYTAGQAVQWANIDAAGAGTCHPARPKLSTITSRRRL